MRECGRHNARRECGERTPIRGTNAHRERKRKRATRASDEIPHAEAERRVSTKRGHTIADCSVTLVGIVVVPSLLLGRVAIACLRALFQSITVLLLHDLP